MPPAVFHPKPSWLPELVYTNIRDDEAVPLTIRQEVLAKIHACGDLASAREAFSKYLASSSIPDVAVTFTAGIGLGHLFYSIGFFKHVAEMIGSGDESLVAAQFEVLRDTSKPRRERRKALERLNRAMRGKPIRIAPVIWLYQMAHRTSGAADLLRDIDACLPWRLALPRAATGSEYIHFEFAASVVNGRCKRPNCRDAGFDNLEIWRHGGVTMPHHARPSACDGFAGFNETLAPPPNYETASQPLGFCVAA
jgi:hypothetical protein